jgi:TolA-binding protein
MFQRVLVLILALCPTLVLAQNKQIQELQRDVAQLQDMVRGIQRSQDEKFAALQVLVQQAVNAATDAGKSAAVIQSGFQQSLRDQQEKVVAPVVGLSSRMDQITSELRMVSQAVTDLTGFLSKLQAQLTDLNNAVKVMQTPAAPPPSGGTGLGSGAPDIPTISASDLYNNANRDRLGGKLDLALQQYADYLRWYGNTDLAPNAQFYIASIHSSQGDYETAVREFDIVLEKYPDNNKTIDAMYGKGQALFKLGRRTEGAREFLALVKRDPRHDLAPKACEMVRSVGMNCTIPRAGSQRGTAKKKD